MNEATLMCSKINECQNGAHQSINISFPLSLALIIFVQLSNQDMSDKVNFVENLKKRIKVWVVRVIKFCKALPYDTAVKVITNQLIKSATSVGANQRAASRGRSDREFYSKLSITVEEADESCYWLEIIAELDLPYDKEELQWLLKEADEITKILGKSRDTIRRRLQK